MSDFKPKSKTVKWTDQNDSDDDQQHKDNQQQNQSINESSNTTDQNVYETNPEAIIKSLSISNQDTIINGTKSQITKDNECNVSQKKIGHLKTKQEVSKLFHEYQSNKETYYACKFCPTTIKKQSRSTANLRRHVGFAHGETTYLFKSQLKQRRSNDSLLSNELEKKLDEKQVNAIILDSRPFGDFSKEGMRDFLDTAVPGYKPLHRTTVRKRISKLYTEHRHKLRQILESISDLALTTDIWTDS
ncbi:hypothetical protein I4U23_011328 [Adineta vaga]|nr:hypothetical protein I4U23_011328 [Adineta vaga]